MQSFRLLAKERSMITGRFQTGKYSFLSTVIDVLPDKNLLVLDYGPNESVNSKLLEAPFIAFSARYRGVDVRFSSTGLEKKRYQGLPVFVIEIPDSLYWKESRKSYRLELAVRFQLECRVPLVSENPKLNGTIVELRVINLARGGVCLYRPFDKDLPVKVGSRLIDCFLSLPTGLERIDLEVRHQTRVDPNDELSGWRIGCAFLKPDQRFESRIMQYMFEVERQQKKV